MNEYSTYDYSAGANVDPQSAAAGMAILGGFLIFMFIFILVIYVYMSICLMKIAKKTNTENAWLAWIPIANVILMLQIAQKPLWWIILFFIPLVNIVFTILVWMEIAKAVKKPDWLGILMIVPIANFIIPGYLAFSKSEEAPVVAVPPAPAI